MYLLLLPITIPIFYKVLLLFFFFCSSSRPDERIKTEQVIIRGAKKHCYRLREISQLLNVSNNNAIFNKYMTKGHT